MRSSSLLVLVAALAALPAGLTGQERGEDWRPPPGWVLKEGFAYCSDAQAWWQQERVRGDPRWELVLSPFLSRRTCRIAEGGESFQQVRGNVVLDGEYVALEVVGPDRYIWYVSPEAFRAPR